MKCIKILDKPERHNSIICLWILLFHVCCILHQMIFYTGCISVYICQIFYAVWSVECVWESLTSFFCAGKNFGNWRFTVLYAGIFLCNICIKTHIWLCTRVFHQVAGVLPFRKQDGNEKCGNITKSYYDRFTLHVCASCMMLRLKLKSNLYNDIKPKIQWTACRDTGLLITCHFQNLRRPTPTLSF